MAPRTNSQIVFDCNYCDKVYTVKTGLQSHSKHNKKVTENTKKTEAIKTSLSIMNELVDNVIDSVPQVEQIDLNNEWFDNTNTDLAEMLERIEATIIEDNNGSELADEDREIPELQET